MSDHSQSPDQPLLPTIDGPEALKELPADRLSDLAAELREEILAVTSANGGHVGPNLGVVELSIALHRVFSTPTDRFTFDVSHQGYIHKLLTGRQGERFKKIRQSGGLSGFLSREESEHDSWGAGHAGTALSAALGMATARDRRGSDEHIVAIIGDAALSCGITMEALNNISTSTERLIIVLNDNEWSIGRNVGALSKYLTELITNPVYNRFNEDLGSLLRKLPGGGSLLRVGSKAKHSAKSMVSPVGIFEQYGVRYIGPIDGHDIPLLIRSLEFAKASDEPILLHVITTKGKGYEVAIEHPEKFHGTGAFDIETGKNHPSKPNTPPNYQTVFGETIAQIAQQNDRVVGITAAMAAGTGLSKLAAEVPDQFFDVGIAEEHAVLFAGGMATQGFHPVCAIYSTFLQRAYDQIVHDICLQNLPVTFAIDRAGLSPNDGPTHHGLFDFAYLRTVPNTIVMQPRNEDELVDMLYTAVATPSPTFVRYPRGAAEGVPIKAEPQLFPIGKAEVLRPTGEIAIWALGPMVKVALEVADLLLDNDGVEAIVVNARFVKPLDSELLLRHAEKSSLIATIEDHSLPGGFGSAVAELLIDNRSTTPLERVGWPDAYVEHGSSVETLREAHGLTPEAIYRRILSRISHRQAESVTTH